MAFMGAAEVRNGRFGLLLDVIYADLSQNGDGISRNARTLSRPRSERS